VPVGRFIVDFYCAELKLAIEVDGAHHSSPGMDDYDARRTQWLQERGIEVVRISNELLARDSFEVEQIVECAIARAKR
jgi:very-short-patch-repair endonuclease